MSDNPFSAPAAAQGIKYEDHKGRLFLVEPKKVEEGIATNFGEKEAVRADVTVIDAEGAPAVYIDTLIFPQVLISQTRSLIGQMVLGRLGQGQAKPGQKPPWMLEEASDADTKIGLKYLESRTQVNPFASVSADEL